MEFTINIVNDNVIYQYDGDGDSPALDYYDGPLSLRVDAIAPFEYVLYHQNGEEFSSSEYDNCKVEWVLQNNSLLEFDRNLPYDIFIDDNYTIYSASGRCWLPYKIANKYSKEQANNTVLLLRITFNNETVEKYVNVQFIKDGESGTNGSKYAAVVTYNDIPYGQENINGISRKLHFVQLNGKWKYIVDGDFIDFADVAPGQTFKFDVDVYRDGVQQLKTESNYQVEFSIFNREFNFIDRDQDYIFSIDTDGYLSINQNLTINIDELTKYEHCMVQAKITIQGEEAQSDIYNTQTVIYAYYPIEYSIIQGLVEDLEIFPKYFNLRGGFNTVIYESDGTNPQYDNSQPFSCNFNHNIPEVLNDYYILSWLTSPHLNVRTVEDDDSAAIIRPSYKFDNGDSDNYIAIDFKIDEEKINNAYNVNMQLLRYCESGIELLQALLYNFNLCINFSVDNVLSDLYKKEAEAYKSLTTEEQEIIMVLEKLARKLKGDE